MTEQELRAELERLRAWQREAMTLFDGLQDLGRALDLPLGTLITGPLALEAAERLRAERDAALASLETRVFPPVVDWWITDQFFDKGGRKIMGPFATRDLAMEVRTLRENVEGHAAYFIDSLPRVIPPERDR